MADKSITTDEIAHITGGYTFNHWSDFRLHPENGILPQRWQALPLDLAGVNYPSREDEAWSKSNVWSLGHRFLYESGNDHEAMLARARAMNALFGVATVLMVFVWSYRLWGPTGAVVSGFFAALCPTMLAHSGLATSDMSMTFFFLAALGAYWRHLHSGTWSAWLLSAVLFGLAAVAKHSSLLLIPVVAGLALIRFCNRQPVRLGNRIFSGYAEKFLAIALSLGGHILIVVVCIWTFFGFRYSAFNPALPHGEFMFPWVLMLSFGGIKAQVIEFFRTWHLLPEGYLYGLAFVLKHSEARAAFLDGEYGLYGWIRFFPLTFVYKTPPSLLAGIFFSAGFVIIRFRNRPIKNLTDRLYLVAPLVTLFAVYWIYSLTSHLNIGHRHILPTYPVLYIFCGALGWAAQQAMKRSRREGTILSVGAASLLGWHATITAEIHPHYLAYFSPLAGGPTHGYQHLVDSSLDWGQDLPGVKQWLSTHQKPGEAVFLSYAGNGDPDYYHIQAVQLPMFTGSQKVRPWYRPEPGIYVIGASMLQQVFSGYRGPWTVAKERGYQKLRTLDSQFRAFKADPLEHPELVRDTPAIEWTKRWNSYDELRFARLCHYLRARPPDAMIGYSILIFRLDQKELDDALEGDLRQLADAVEHAPQHRPMSPVAN